MRAAAALPVATATVLVRTACDAAKHEPAPGPSGRDGRSSPARPAFPFAAFRGDVLLGIRARQDLVAILGRSSRRGCRRVARLGRIWRWLWRRRPRCSARNPSRSATSIFAVHYSCRWCVAQASSGSRPGVGWRGWLHIYSRSDETTNAEQVWTLHATGTVAREPNNGAASGSERETVEQMRVRLPEATSGQDYYRRLDERSVH